MPQEIIISTQRRKAHWPCVCVCARVDGLERKSGCLVSRVKHWIILGDCLLPLTFPTGAAPFFSCPLLFLCLVLLLLCAIFWKQKLVQRTREEMKFHFEKNMEQAFVWLFGEYLLLTVLPLAPSCCRCNAHNLDRIWHNAFKISSYCTGSGF